MAAEPGIEDAESELTALRRRVDALERERHERIARANEALAAAQDRAYWLDRWNLDLNALMRRRGAGELRAALRALRKLYRLARSAGWELKELGPKVASARRNVEDEKALARGSEPGPEPFRRRLSPDLLRAAPVTELLYDRLTDEDVAAVEARLEPGEAAEWEVAEGHHRMRLALAFAAHHRIQPALERSGLSDATPDARVHAMARGASAAGGSAYYADLVVDSLSQSGLDLASRQSGLDFGCSSGRVVRVLAAAHPELDWHGCDPIPDAIEWARANLPGIAFERSPEYPPLPYEDGSFDLVFAISIWSHFAERAALDWLAEMRRILRPGGRLLITTHGEQTIAHTHSIGSRSAEQLRGVRDALHENGFWYAAEFGAAGDHGVANPDWGTSFLSAEWLLTKATPEWRVAFFRPGRVEGDQDVYVLEPR
jgi:SAM-dependent methyltransferase